MKKLGKSNLKLKLHRETLQALEIGKLDQVHGGTLAVTNCAICNTDNTARNTCLC